MSRMFKFHFPLLTSIDLILLSLDGWREPCLRQLVLPRLRFLPRDPVRGLRRVRVLPERVLERGAHGDDHGAEDQHRGPVPVAGEVRGRRGGGLEFKKISFPLHERSFPLASFLVDNPSSRSFPQHPYGFSTFQ